MEKEGLMRSIEMLKNADITVGKLITDRHVQIVKWVRENLLDVDHRFDTWHVAKGLKKKLNSLGNERECGIVHDWVKSIINHLHWTAASTPDGDKQAMLEKWQSFVNHLANIHEHTNLELFPTCQHPNLHGYRDKWWFITGTKAYKKLFAILMSAQLTKDVQRLSSGKQTSRIEGFHSLINHFAPKMYGFSYLGMKTRIALVALHHNANRNRGQAKTKKGEDRYDIVYV